VRGWLAAVVRIKRESGLAKSSMKTAYGTGFAVANAVHEFLRVPQLDADQLPPVRYRKQAGTLTERYVDLVRSAMSSPS
jgi:hypothetical protein